MLPSERQQAILREVELRGGVTVSDFASRTGVSGMTIRRDLFDLERDGLLTRVHGGAVRRPPPSAARGRTPMLTIGFIVPSANYYFPGFINGAKAAAAEQNVRLVLGVTEYQQDIERHQIARLIHIGIDGLVVTPSGPPGETASGAEESYRLLADAGIPVVIMERSLADKPAEVPLGGVRSDHAYGSMLAIRHLVESGRKRIAIVSPTRGTTADPLHEGYRRTMADLLPDSPLLEFDLTGSVGTPEQRASCEEIFDELVKAEVDGVLVLPDAVAIALLDRAMDRGIKVPEELAIVAYDDEIASLATVPLTAVSPPKFDVGAVAVRTCVGLINQRDGVGRLPAQARVQLLPALVVRDSTRRRETV
ncbi:LacI family DNA-binding transcriptional regulator [Microbacterium sp. CFBP 13617]|uniref:LacI family DNA-binding transcriptional regulator n=1 Tax=Microbacterium sp. CFBP 13617 TaxID=2774035 RepID=UPI0017848A1C|nr:LacI family DNA-binding transcriptional regulator [Microbacterium sp. CFBP 13617]MBD8217721.1 LacI family DNA-binding transcriptional regulator [Microbacterium sp. CFBP 13617]